MRSLCDICEQMKWSQHVMSDIFSCPSIKLSMGFNMQCNKLLNDSKSIPQSVFTHNTKMGTAWLLKTISIPFTVDLVYISGNKFKVLIVFFIENKQQDDSFHLLTIIKTNKTKTLFSVSLIEYIFLPQGDLILNNNSISTHDDCFKTVSPLQVHI